MDKQPYHQENFAGKLKSTMVEKPLKLNTLVTLKLLVVPSKEKSLGSLFVTRIQETVKLLLTK